MKNKTYLFSANPIRAKPEKPEAKAENLTNKLDEQIKKNQLTEKSNFFKNFDLCFQKLSR
jgi:hypothetical protein